jgi:hypothetical protein
MLEVYVLSGMCLVLIIALVFQIQPPVVQHKGKIAVRSGNRIIKITTAELQAILAENTAQLERLHRSTTDEAAMLAVAAQIRRFIVANDDAYNFPLISDFMTETQDIDEPMPAFAMLRYELARLEILIQHRADKSMLDLDLMADLIARMHADQSPISYTGENQPSTKTGPNCNAALGALPALKFGESTELDHRWHKPSRDYRPSQGEQSQEYERDF